MPRIPTSIIRTAYARHRFLPLLLRACRDLQSAENELRWLREHLSSVSRQRSRRQPLGRDARLKKLCVERSIGTPLQYILETQPFGDLEILCKKGVLIPRPETDSITHHLAKVLRASCNGDPRLRILDLCSGTGCISLLLHSLLACNFRHLHVRGIDVSSTALHLAARNVDHNIRLGKLNVRARSDVQFEFGDILSPGQANFYTHGWDVVVSNPPYISPQSFLTTTARSVRDYEPRAALVPPATSATSTDQRVGDSFYPKLLQIADRVNARFFLVEVADLAQAVRVVELISTLGRWKHCEVWRDWPDVNDGATEEVSVAGIAVKVYGSGNGRAVFARSFSPD